MRSAAGSALASGGAQRGGGWDICIGTTARSGAARGSGENADADAAARRRIFESGGITPGNFLGNALTWHNLGIGDHIA